jgi:hypothetical protein
MYETNIEVRDKLQANMVLGKEEDMAAPVEMAPALRPVRCVGRDSFFLLPCLGPSSMVEMFLLLLWRCAGLRLKCDGTWGR